MATSPRQALACSGLGSAVATTLGIATVYFAAAKLGLALAFTAQQVTVVWPPSGLALAAVVLLGRRRAWAGVALGAFLANLTANEPIGTAAAIATGNTLEAVLGAALLARQRFRPGLDRLRDVLALCVFAAGTSTLVAATVGVTSLCLGDVQPWSAFATLWWIWWVGDALGDLLVAPLLFVWTRPQPALRPTDRRLEAGLLLVATIATSLAVFARSTGATSEYPLHYGTFPLVTWAALRFGQRGTTTLAFLVAGIAIWSTVGGSGPFAMGTVQQSLVMLQLFMAVVAVTGLLLGAAITERVVARQRAASDYERLQNSEGRLRLALDAGRMGVWDWNVLTGEVKWTGSMEAIFGLSPGAFPGTLEGFLVLVHPDDRDFVNEAIAHAVDQGTGYEVEFRSLRGSGGVGWVFAKGRVLRDAGGRATRMLGVATDVTERRRLAEELRERAAELAASDRRKDEFLAMLSHELRTPLAPLGAALHLLRAPTGDRERALAIAERQMGQLVRLVDDLLDVSRITQGKVVLRIEAVWLDEVIARAVETVRATLDARGQVFRLTLPGERIALEADPPRLAQIVANLLANASKYTPPGGTIEVLAARAEQGVDIRVRDTGAGIAPDVLPRVFDLFVQGDRTLDRGGGGLGVGLTVVRGLVELHGGRVEARSAGPGAGSEFVVHLPVSARAPEPQLAPAPPRPRRGTPVRVLVVEDNEDAAQGLAAVLRLVGHEVRVAASGAAALEIVESWAPQVVISDLGLPEMDGYQLARALRARPQLAGAMLVALTGYGRDEDRRRAVDAGFDRHLVKPPDLDVLLDLLARAPDAAAAASGTLG